MGILNRLSDKLTSGNFEIESSMKVSDLSKKFKNRFNLSLRVYKGSTIVKDGRTTINSLDQRTTKKVQYNDKLRIKATMKVGEVEQLFDKHFGLKVQIADKANKVLVSNSLTLGEAKRNKD